MAGLVIQLLILAILLLILLTIFIDEKRLKTTKSPTAKLTGYWNGAERRTSIRIATILQIRYYVEDKSHQLKTSLTKNISSGGILMQSNEKLFPPTRLFLDIFLPNTEKPIIARGEVVWVQELPHMDEIGKRVFDTGIKFVSMNSKDREKLDQHIKNLL